VGGNASATLNVSGSGEVVANTNADGGWSHVVGGGVATTVINATGATVDATGNATDGGSDDLGARATATVTATGNAGYAEANATSTPQQQTTVPVAPYAEYISSSASVSVTGETVKALAVAQYGAGVPALGATPANALAEGSAAPTSTAGILAANHDIKVALGPTPPIFDIGAVGGGGAGTSAGETITDTVSCNINASELASGGNLVLGLYGAKFIGNASDACNIVLHLQTGFFGSTQLNETFTTLGQAAAAFTDGVAPLVNNAFSNSGELQLDFTLTVQTSVAGDGFWGDFLIGDPPAAMGPHEDRPIVPMGHGLLS
jgi:hypothetical protein